MGKGLLKQSDGFKTSPGMHFIGVKIHPIAAKAMSR